MAYGTIDSLDTSNEVPGTASPPYSIFTISQKRLIVFLTAYTTMFSPLSSFIYYPAIGSLASSLHTSIALINVTITSYLIVAGIAPTLLGNMADTIGRRPVYLSILSIYIVANVGLALQSCYAALLVLRMVQSFGASATIAIAYGIIADIATPAERGVYTGTVFLGPNVAPLLGPVLGGFISDHWGWRWIFWFLAVSSSLCFCLLALFLPETSRRIVGNGSSKVHGIHRTIIDIIWSRKISATMEGDRVITKRSYYIPNPLATISILFQKETALIMTIHATFYTTFGCLLASMSSLFTEVYGLSASQAGLIYLPGGIACLLASYLSGKMIDRDYKIAAHYYAMDDSRSQELSTFPIEKARLRSAWFLITMSALSILGYGWSIQQKLNIAIPLTFHFLLGFPMVGMFNSLSTLLTDIHPSQPSTAQAALNIVRCSLSAAGLLVLQPTLDTLGVGWCFTLLASFLLATLGLVWTVWEWGMGWRLDEGLDGEREVEELLLNA